jgi:hypothetical protein
MMEGFIERTADRDKEDRFLALDAAAKRIAGDIEALKAQAMQLKGECNSAEAADIEDLLSNLKVDLARRLGLTVPKPE